MTNQSRIWEGEFGKEYTNRNVIDWRTRLTAFQWMLDGLRIERVLEVGCNRGHNLVALVKILGEGADLVGVEANRYSLEIAKVSSTKVDFLCSHAIDLPFEDEYFDLVFTAGVLIHISPTDLPLALAEIYRVTKRYILAIEYFSEEDTVVHYRGYDDLLWKRDILKLYRAQFIDLTLIRSGYWGLEDGFDRMHWWLFEKPIASHEK